MVKGNLSRFGQAVPASGAEGGTSDETLAATLAAQLKTFEILKEFIINLTKALIAAGAGSAVSRAYAELGSLNSEAAMNVLSDYESEDDSHLFSQQQELVE